MFDFVTGPIAGLAVPLLLDEVNGDMAEQSGWSVTGAPTCFGRVVGEPHAQAVVAVSVR